MDKDVKIAEDIKIIDGVVYQAMPQAKMEVVPEVVTTETNVTVVEQEVAEVSFDFARVNINEPTSILTYGLDVKKAISDVLISTANMAVNQEQSYLSDEMLNKIVSFDESLEQARKSQEVNEGVLKRLIRSAKVALGNKDAKKEEDMKTYQGRYKDYTDNLNLVCEQAELIKQNALADIELRKEIAIEIAPYIQKLLEMIDVGEKDKEAFDQETKKIGLQDNSEDAKLIVSGRTQLSNAFAMQLNGLRKALVLYKAQLQQYVLQQGVAMTEIQQCDTFINDQAPILQAQASVQIFNFGDSERLADITQMNEAANLAITSTVKNLEQNVESATNLMLNGGFTMDTINQVNQSLQRGVSLIKKAKKDLVVKAAKEKAELEKADALLEENKREILDLIQDSSAAITAIEEKNSSYGKRLKPFRPSRIGKK